MRNVIFAGLLISGLAASAPVLAQTNADEVAQLKQRVAQLEKQVQEISEVVAPLKEQLAADKRRQALRAQFEKKMTQDQQKYTSAQLGEAEQLYQVANRKWGTPKAAQSLQTMIEKYPDINRTGCAVLYVAQNSKGEARTRYLQQCIEKHDNCFYGDGVQVGPYARLMLAEDYQAKGDTKKAAELYREIQTKYPEAVDHNGKLLVDVIAAESQ